MPASMFVFIAISVGILILVILSVSLISRYKRCSSDRIMVIYGKIGKGQSARCIHGGAAFIWPVIQDFSFLDLTPIQIEVDLDNALSKQNIRVSVPSNFTVGISTKPEIMIAAAERLLGMQVDSIKNLARDIIIGQMRLVIATMDIEEINADRDKFLEYIYKNVETELEKIGLRLINVNIKDLQDESGYIASLGKKAAADALNKAKKDVAEKDRDGAIGEAEARREQVIKVADAQSAAVSGQANADRAQRVNVATANSLAVTGEADAHKSQRINVANFNADASVGEASAQQIQRIKMADANARAVEGENVAAVAIANSTSEMRERKAEAERRAAATEKVQAAQALQESYTAEKMAEQIRAERDYASQQADIVVKTRIEKEQKVIEAEAEAARLQKVAEGEAAATFAKMEAQARGIQEILSKQAEGLERIVKAAGNDPNKAATLLIIDKLPELVKTQVEAIKNLKIDKIVVWDNGGAGGSSTANFVSNLVTSFPPLQSLLNMAGMQLPEFLAKAQEGSQKEEVRKKAL